MGSQLQNLVVNQRSINSLSFRREAGILWALLVGGCACNGTANGKITNETPYKQLWIPPAPSDAGSAIGCALEYYYTHTDYFTSM